MKDEDYENLKPIFRLRAFFLVDGKQASSERDFAAIVKRACDEGDHINPADLIDTVKTDLENYINYFNEATDGSLKGKPLIGDHNLEKPVLKLQKPVRNLAGKDKDLILLTKAFIRYLENPEFKPIIYEETRRIIYEDSLYLFAEIERDFLYRNGYIDESYQWIDSGRKSSLAAFVIALRDTKEFFKCRKGESRKGESRLQLTKPTKNFFEKRYGFSPGEVGKLFSGSTSAVQKKITGIKQDLKVYIPEMKKLLP